jgi:cyanate permease
VSSTIGALYTGAALGNAAGPWVAGRVVNAQGSYAAVILGCAVLSPVAMYAGWRGERR